MREFLIVDLNVIDCSVFSLETEKQSSMTKILLTGKVPRALGGVM